MIEGDNYDALLNLQYTHKGKIDLIYIDPPYNTGKDGFRYNDKRVDKEDSFRHSKWLSFMAPRLALAKELLSDNGVIFISIDDNEQAPLRLLCDFILGRKNYINNLAVENNPKGRKNSSFISTSHESCLIYAKNQSDQSTYFIESIRKSKIAKDSKGKEYTPGRRVLVGKSSNKPVSLESRKCYSVYYSSKESIIKLKKENASEIDNGLINKDFVRYRSISDEGILLENTYTDSKLQELFNNDALIFKENSIYEKDFNIYSRMKSILKSSEQYDVKNETSGKLLKEILSKEFSFPKNIEFIQALVDLLDNKNCKIVDFFSGSGTTAYAVLALNAEDGGSRECIIVTNNEGGEENPEQGIARSVCHQRIKKVIQGYEKQNNKKEKAPGLGGSLEYWRTGEKRAKIETEDDWLELMKNIDILSLKEGIKFSETKEDEKDEQLIISGEDRSFTVSDQFGTDYKLSLNSKEEGSFPGEMIAAYQAAIEIVEEVYLDPISRFFTEEDNSKANETIDSSLEDDAPQSVTKEEDDEVNEDNQNEVSK